MKKIAGENVLYPELSYKIMEIIFEVHNKLGPGFTEYCTRSQIAVWPRLLAADVVTDVADKAARTSVTTAT